MQNDNRDYDPLIHVIRKRRSVRRFEPGRSVPRETLLKIAEAARWAPTGANSQCFDLVIVDEPEMRERVLDVFLAQSNRLIDHVKGFPGGQEDLHGEHGRDFHRARGRTLEALISGRDLAGMGGGIQGQQ